MKKLLTILSLISLLPASAAKVASLDMVQIYQEYSLVQEANAEVDEAEARFKRILATAEQELKELEAQGKKEEIEKKRVEIQDVVDDQVEALHDTKELYNTTINRNIARLLNSMATSKGYDLIVDKSFILVPIDDITNEFIAQLEKTKKSPSKK